MSIHLHPYLSALWFVAVALRIILLGIVVIRKSHWPVKTFKYYLLLAICRSLLLIWFSWFEQAWPYTWTFWIASPLIHAAALACCVECFSKAFRPYRAMPGVFVRQAGAPFSLLITFVCALALYHPANWSSVDRGFMTLDRSLAILICGSFWLISLLSDYYRIPWHTRFYGVGVGFMFLYSTQVAISTVRAFTQWGVAMWLWPVGITVDIIATLVWIRFYLKKEPTPQTVTPEQLEQIKKLIAKFQEALS